MSRTEDGRDKISPSGNPEDMFDSWLTDRSLDFISPEAEKDYRDRVHRINDAVRLRVPDRIPVYANIAFPGINLAAESAGGAGHDYDKLIAASRDYILDLQPDVHGCSMTPGPVIAYEILDYRPGLRADSNYSSGPPDQTAESEYMRADEYDDLIRDPSDFWLRKYIPRIFGKLKAFRELNSPGSLLQMPFNGTFLDAFGRPEMRPALEALISAGEEAAGWRRAVSSRNKQVTEAGYPLMEGGSTLAPYDVIAGTLRGTRGVMTDIYRQPEKLTEAMERLLPVMFELGAESARAAGKPLVFIPLHKGADDFMSDEQYRTFYWPTLKKMISMYAERGIIPFLFAEGEYASRLEIIRDVPVGQVIWHFDFTDMALAREAMRGIACIAGNVPISLLNTGTPEEVKEYCKKLIDIAGRDGGFIMTSGGVIDKALPENVKAMVGFTREYGVYR